ncbi:MAG: hypothetical protein CK425_09790 [Parachlamydia sp.]|nr:MAG: hypothetical protein CK425_09790 [Parachlamydia sp.]
MTSLNVHFATAEAISLLLYPFAEVVVHNLATGQIAAIYNNFSKRNIGDESLLEELKDYNELPNIFPVYSKVNWDGRKIKSISATLRDQAGNAIGLLCMNLDLSKWEQLHQFLGNWLQGLNAQTQPAVLFKDDWREKINLYVSEYLAKEGIPLKQLSKEKKKALISSLHAEGAFKAKNAAHYIADVLDLSRATIYNYLR